jgi:Patatin-like phospholipase
MEPHLFNLVAYRLPWLLWLLVTILWYSRFGRATPGRMLGRLSENWFPMALIMVVNLMAAGQIGADLGIPMLFRNDPSIGFNWNSPALWGAYSATVLIGEVWFVIYLLEYLNHYDRLDPARRQTGWDPLKQWATPSKRLRKFRDSRSALEYLAATTPPFLGVLILIAALPAGLVGGPKYSLERACFDMLEYGLGILLGALTVAAAICGGWWLALRAAGFGWLRRGVVRTIILLRANDLTRTANRGMATAVAIAFWTFVVVALIAGTIVINWSTIVPSFAICTLFGLISAVYLILVSLRRSLQLPFLFALVAFSVWSNSGAYKYRLPGMGTVNGVSLYAEANLVQANLSSVETAGPEKPLLDNIDVLNAWKDNLGVDRPKLVIVAVTGGAYRSGFWTAAVLDELDRRSRTDPDLKGLTDHIRLMTGASGGMVGASYFVALRGQPSTDLVDRMMAETNRDSLSPVIQQLVQRDIPLIFHPIAYQKVDRGVVLEDQWKTLAIPFIHLYEEEKRGQRPSLIVSPMVIESGERMLISNLDLRHLVQPHSVRGEPYLRSAREFFRMFPEAQPTFGLQTAIRLSATFPYVSPAVSLPTHPPRRLVDAGYYDNYGVNLAVAWAYQYRDWIRNNTSGLALIQIYAFPRSGAFADERGPEEADPGEARRGFQWLSSPIEGALGARNWSMLYRNDEQLRLLDDTFNSADDTVRTFETFSFEYPGGAAMNWIITRDDIDDMRRSIAAGLGVNPDEKSKNDDEMSRLIAWWNNRPTAVRQQRKISAPDQAQGIKFKPSHVITPDVQKKLNSVIYRFRVYVHRLGFTPKRAWVEVEDLPDDPVNMYYSHELNAIRVGKELADEYDGIMRDYTHYICFENGTHQWEDLVGLESGLADYFPCSFKGSPEFGARAVEIVNKANPGQFSRPYLRELDNARRFDTLEDSPESHDEGEVWGGAFWEMRHALGKDAQGNNLADVLLLRTVMNLTPPGVGKEARVGFVRQLLEQERRVTGGRFAAAIRDVFRKRGLTL